MIRTSGLVKVLDIRSGEKYGTEIRFAEQVIPEWDAAATRALEIDGNISEVHLSFRTDGFFYYWEWEKAEQSFKKAIEINPNNAEAVSYYAIFPAFTERFDEADSLSRKSLKIDQLAPLINMNVGWNYFSARIPDKAENQADKMIEIEPDFHGAYWVKGAIHLSEGEYERAVEQLKKPSRSARIRLFWRIWARLTAWLETSRKPLEFFFDYSICAARITFPQFV